MNMFNFSFVKRELEELTWGEGMKNQIFSSQTFPPAHPNETGNRETTNETAQSQESVSKQTMMKKFWNALK